MIDSPVNLHQSWAISAPVAESASSVASAGAVPVDPALWASLFRESVAERSQPTVGKKWVAVGHVSVTGRPLEAGNSTVTSVDYYSCDDLPSALLGISSPHACVGAVGYWSTEASDFFFSPAGDGSVAVIVDELSALCEGWNGDGSVAPSHRVKCDIASTYRAANLNAPEPIIEVADDGSVALLWENDDESFALSFLGNGKVVVTLSPRPAGFVPQAINVDDVDALRRLVALERVTHLLA